MKPAATFAIIFLAASLAMWKLATHLPPLSSDEISKIKVPRSLEDAKVLCSVLGKYKDDYQTEVMIAFSATYIFLQSFTIPGSIFLSIIAGSLFEFPVALILVSFCAATGALNAFLMSSLFGKRLMQHYFPERCAEWRKKVEKHRGHLLLYIIFLRLTPLVPNWFVNWSSPVVGVPWLPFYFGTFFGVAVPSIFFVRAGAAIQDIGAVSDILSWRAGVWMTLGGAVLLLPVLFKSRLQKLD